MIPPCASPVPGRLRGLGLPVLLCGCLVLSGCDPRPPAATRPWALRAGESTVAPDEVQLAWTARARDNGSPPLADVVATEVESLAILEQARRSGFLEQPETRRALRLFLANRYREHARAEDGSKAEPAPTEAELRARYAATQARWQRPAVANFAILTHTISRKATPEKQREARERVTGWRAALGAGTNAVATFKERARQNSADQATRHRGGELGWLNETQLRQRLPAAVVDAAATLAQPGEVSVPVETPDALYLVQLVGRRAAEVRPFAEVEAQVRHELAAELKAAREAEFQQRMRAGLLLETNAPVLAELRPPVPKAPGTNVPPAMAAR